MNKKKISVMNVVYLISFTAFVYGVSLFAFSRVVDSAIDRGRKDGISEMRAEAVMNGFACWKSDKYGNLNFFWVAK